MASQKRNWYRNNIPTIVLVLIAMFGLAETRGVIKTELKTKTNSNEVRLIVKEEIRESAFPLEDGMVLKFQYKHIENDLNKIKEKLISIDKTLLIIAKNTELKQKLRTTANGNMSKYMPYVAITPPGVPSGDKNIKIKELDNFRLTK